MTKKYILTNIFKHINIEETERRLLMKVYYFVNPSLCYNTYVYILADSKKEAIKLFSYKYNLSEVVAERCLKKVIKKAGIFLEREEDC